MEFGPKIPISEGKKEWHDVDPFFFWFFLLRYYGLMPNATGIFRPDQVVAFVC